MQAKFSIFTVAAMPLIPIALACGGDDGGGKISVRPDAAKMVDAAPVVCTASTSYTGVTTGSNAQFAGQDGSGMDMQVYWFGRMAPTPPATSPMPDILQVTLYNGYGPFSGGITPQTIQLTGAEADPAMCSACVIMFTDLYTAGSDVEYTDLYFTKSGTLTLTSTSPPDNFQGTISNLVMDHVVISGQNLVSANDGCGASFPSVTMNAPIDVGSGSANFVGTKKFDGEIPVRFVLRNRTL